MQRYPSAGLLGKHDHGNMVVFTLCMLNLQCNVVTNLYLFLVSTLTCECLLIL